MIAWIISSLKYKRKLKKKIRKKLVFSIYHLLPFVSFSVFFIDIGKFFLYCNVNYGAVKTAKDLLEDRWLKIQPIDTSIQISYNIQSIFIILYKDL